MNQLFVPYHLAVKLREKKFLEECLAWWPLDVRLDEPHIGKGTIQGKWSVLSPLYQQVFDWFRTKHNILANVYSNASGYLYEWHDAIGGTHRGDSGYSGPNDSGCWNTYEEARIALIERILKLIQS